jgi:hypothetical protein
MKNTYQKALKKLNELGPTKDNVDLFFRDTVDVSHNDRSHFVFQNATVKEGEIDGIEFLFVWTEHCGYHVFYKTDLDWWYRYNIADDDTPIFIDNNS